MKRLKRILTGFMGLTTLTLLHVSIIAQEPQKLKKITIVNPTNWSLNKNYTVLDLPDSINTPAAKELKTWVLDNGLQQKEKDIEMILGALSWVSSQWSHDGSNSADNLTSLQILKNAKQGIRYRCVEYGRVLASVLRSMGYISRGISMEAVGSPYGPPGSGHFATEVWCDDLQKWIFLDPQFCIYTQYNGKFLNYYEMYELKKQGKWKEINFIVSKGYKGYLAQGSPSEEAHITDYKKFLANYFGAININGRLKNKSVIYKLLLEDPNQGLSFQGFSKDDIIYMKTPDELYFPLNQNTVIFKFKDPQVQHNKYYQLSREGKIKNFEDQVRYMGEFSALPNFLIYQDSNMPWLSHYELFLNYQKIEMNSQGFFEVSLKETNNTLRSVAVNKNGKKGSETVIQLKYE